MAAAWCLVQNYYDPDNSCINCVLERRSGIPITLALVHMQVNLNKKKKKSAGLLCRTPPAPLHMLLAPRVAEPSATCTPQVAQRLGLPMIGVNIPGHFFIAPANPDMEFLVDAFNGGWVGGCLSG